VIILSIYDTVINKLFYYTEKTTFIKYSYFKGGSQNYDIVIPAFASYSDAHAAMTIS